MDEDEYEWVEPFSGGPEPVFCKMKAKDIISCQKRRPEYENLSDIRALEDFIIVHWAHKVIRVNE
jgi:hypothetical protein